MQCTRAPCCVTNSGEATSCITYRACCCTRVCSGHRTGRMRGEWWNGRGGEFRYAPRVDESDMVLITRKIEFSASHLYNNPELSPEENRRVFGKGNNPHGHGNNYALEVTVGGEPDPVTGVGLGSERVFGKCANPYGHGHNYMLEISVSGEVDPATGMVANLADLDSFVEREVIEVFDHHSLNEDVAAFRNVVPTTENLCIEIFERLKRFPKANLERVRVQETTNNSFEYDGNQKGSAS